jgi:hypothetical protein
MTASSLPGWLLSVRWRVDRRSVSLSLEPIYAGICECWGGRLEARKERVAGESLGTKGRPREHFLDQETGQAGLSHD